MQLVSFEADPPFVTDALVDTHQSHVANVTVLPCKVRHLKERSGLLQVGPSLCGFGLISMSDNTMELNNFIAEIWEHSNISKDK